jgi:hypothetical protein
VYSNDVQVMRCAVIQSNVMGRDLI